MAVELAAPGDGAAPTVAASPLAANPEATPAAPATQPPTAADGASHRKTATVHADTKDTGVGATAEASSGSTGSPKGGKASSPETSKGDPTKKAMKGK
eukprot:11000449-Alexandrium_andersonii.AAC.1